MNRALVRSYAVLTAALAIGVTACSDEPGTPTAASTHTTTTTSTSSVAPEDNALADIQPCDLLSAEEAKSLGLDSRGEPDDIAGTTSCDWPQSGNGGLIVGIRPTRGISDLNYDTEKSSEVTIGKYDAVKVEEPNNGKALCQVLIAVSDSSSVQVTGSLKATSTDTAAACERATKAAELIAAKLP
jgi:hypothetical protein